MDAPIEFAGLGASLWKKRESEAEAGSSLVTARKLGALFESDLPEVPRLIQAYGTWVTEIAGQPAANPQGASSDGPFKDHVGADGTTIWAAATSGKNAIAIHLLACILARIPPRPEATVLWKEFVDQRRAVLQQRVRSAANFHSHALYASQISITREQLAEWDGSAR